MESKDKRFDNGKFLTLTTTYTSSTFASNSFFCFSHIYFLCLLVLSTSEAVFSHYFFSSLSLSLSISFFSHSERAERFFSFTFFGNRLIRKNNLWEMGGNLLVRFPLSFLLRVSPTRKTCGSYFFISGWAAVRRSWGLGRWSCYHPLPGFLSYFFFQFTLLFRFIHHLVKFKWRSRKLNWSFPALIFPRVKHFSF